MKFNVQLEINATIECAIHAENIEEALEIAQREKKELWNWGRKVDQYVMGEERVVGVYELE